MMRKIFKNYEFGKANILLVLQYLSEFGDKITLALLALLVLKVTNKTSEVGFIYLLNTVGFLIFTIIGGYLGDLISKRKILIFSETGRGLVVLIMILGIHENSIGLIYIASFLLSMLGAFSKPATLSLWAQYVPEKHLERYNYLSQYSVQGSDIIGPLIASLLVSFSFVYWGFAIDSLTFFICAISFAKIVIDKPVKEKRKKKDILRGFKLIFRDIKILMYVSFDTMQMLGHGAFNATFLVLAQRDLAWSETTYSWHMAIVAGLGALGAFSGTKNLVANLTPFSKLFSCAIVSGISLSLVLYLKVFPLVSICLGICALVAVIAGGVTKTKAQKRAKKNYPDSTASILAARSVLIKLATVIGIFSCLALDNFLGLELALWIHIMPITLGFLPLILWQERAKQFPPTNIKAINID